MKRKTDLAIEATELWREQHGDPGVLEGVRTWEDVREGCGVTTVEVTSQAGAEAVGKPVGLYVTLSLEAVARREEDAFGRAVRALAAELRTLLALKEGESVLVVGIGNRAVTPDAVGPRAADHTMVTRHLVEQIPEHFGHFRPVSALAAGVLASTGVESGELVRALAERIRPDRIIAVDALASRSLSRLCTTVQLADTGITPGSGVGNARRALNRETLGVPVVAVGVPTVVSAHTLAADLLERSQTTLPPELEEEGGMVVTPKDIDVHVADMAKIIGYGINLALQDGLTVEDVDLFLS